MEVYSLTNVAKYRSFQYRVLHRALVTNVHLERWGLRPNDCCSFCGTEKETILHMLIECDRVQDLWNSLFEYFKDKFKDVQVVLSSPNIILNRIAVNKKSSHVLNFLCLVAKQYIYRQRCLNQSIHFPMLESIFRRIEFTEKYIATKNGKLLKHNVKWYSVQVIENECIPEYISRYIDKM